MLTDWHKKTEAESKLYLGGNFYLDDKDTNFYYFVKLNFTFFFKKSKTLTAFGQKKLKK